MNPTWVRWTVLGSPSSPMRVASTPGEKKPVQDTVTRWVRSRASIPDRSRARPAAAMASPGASRSYRRIRVSVVGP